MMPPLSYVVFQPGGGGDGGGGPFVAACAAPTTCSCRRQRHDSFASRGGSPQDNRDAISSSIVAMTNQMSAVGNLGALGTDLTTLNNTLKGYIDTCVLGPVDPTLLPSHRMWGWSRALR